MVKFKKCDVVKLMEMGASSNAQVGHIYTIDEDDSEIPFAIDHDTTYTVRAVLDQDVCVLVHEITHVKTGRTMFKRGQKAILLAPNDPLNKGDIVTLDDGFEESTCPWVLTEDGERVIVDLENLCPIKEEQTVSKQIIKTKKIIKNYMRTISIKLRAALGEVKANQIVAELRNEDLSLTCTGKDIVLNAIADGENPVDALATEATRIIEAAKKA